MTLKTAAKSINGHLKDQNHLVPEFFHGNEHIESRCWGYMGVRNPRIGISKSFVVKMYAFRSTSGTSPLRPFWVTAFVQTFAYHNKAKTK